MTARTVSCGSCDHSWKLAGGGSVYEREAVESRPCPRCGAYTLRSQDPPAPGKGRFRSNAFRVARVGG